MCAAFSLLMLCFASELGPGFSGRPKQRERPEKYYANDSQFSSDLFMHSAPDVEADLYNSYKVLKQKSSYKLFVCSEVTGSGNRCPRRIGEYGSSVTFVAV